MGRQVGVGAVAKRYGKQPPSTRRGSRAACHRVRQNVHSAAIPPQTFCHRCQRRFATRRMPVRVVDPGAYVVAASARALQAARTSQEEIAVYVTR